MKLSLKEVIIVEGKYDKIRLNNLIDSPIFETNGFRIFKDKDKQNLIRRIAENRGILIFTDSDSAGFVIRNFLKNITSAKNIKNCYIPPVSGKEKRKRKPSKEGILGVEGVTDEIIIDAIKKSGASIIGEASTSTLKSELTKEDLYDLGLSGTENSKLLREKLYKKLDLPKYLSSNSLINVLNMLYSYEELKAILNDLS